MDFILDHLAIGSAADAWARPEGINALLCVAEEIELPPGYARATKVPMRDMQPIPQAQLAEAARWLAQQVPQRRVLVFCSAGVGRSTSAVVGYSASIATSGSAKPLSTSPAGDLICPFSPTSSLASSRPLSRPDIGPGF